jgi:hypothetical protein
MLSINDVLFIIWTLLCIGLIFLTPGKICQRTYSRMIAGIFILSCLVTIWFHETVIDVSQVSPIHGGVLALAQVATLTLTSKLWLTINFHKLSRFFRAAIYILLYTALLAIVVCSYWLYKFVPELQVILNPIASLAISITAQILEDRWESTKHLP